MPHPGDPIRAVLFDAVGTLIRPEPKVAEAYLSAARRFGADRGLSTSQVESRFHAAFARQEALDRAANWITDEARERRRWQDIVAEVFADPPHGPQLFDALWDHFAHAENWALIDAAREKLAAARNAGLIVGVASNFDARLRRILADLPDLNPNARENAFLSSEIGWRKPSPNFFRAIEAALHLSAAELLLVGDDEANDHQAARTAGWAAERVESA